MAGNTITVTAKERTENKKNSGGSSGSVGTSNSNSNSTVQYDPNVDYASLIQSAVQRGESQSVIDSLNAQRNAKISGMGLNYSALTADDIAGYKSTANGTGRTTYDSAGVIGGMDNGNYGITNPTTKDWSNYNAGVDFDERIAAAKASGASEDTIKGLEQMKQYTNDVRSGKTIPYGYGEGMGYGDRNTRYNFTLKDGSKVSVPVNATRYEDAAKLAGINLDDIAGMNSITYGTGSSAYAKPGYGFGTIMGSNDFTTDLRNNDPTGRFSNMNNMQLAFLSGRDGMDYQNPYAGLAYNGNGITNAYNKGTDFAGQGDIMGGYDFNFQLPDGTNLNDTAAKNNYNYELPTAQNGYVDPTTGAQSTYQDILDKYAEAISQQNAAQAAQFKYEQDQANQGYDETQKANYINYMLAKKNIPASLQTQGVNGGMAESTRSALESDYMANYNATENARVNTSAQIDIAAQNALASNNMQAAEVYAGLAQSMLEYEQTAAYHRNQYNLSIMQMQQAQTQWEAEMAYQKAQDSYNATLQAQQMAAQEKQYAIEYAYQVQDWDTYGNLTGTDTSYMKQLSQAELESQLLANAKKNSSLSRGTGGGTGRGTNEDNNPDNTDYTSLIDSYINNSVDGYGGVNIPGFSYRLTPEQVRAGLSNGTIVADVSETKGRNTVRLASGEYARAAGWN